MKHHYVPGSSRYWGHSSEQPRAHLHEDDILGLEASNNHQNEVNKQGDFRCNKRYKENKQRQRE